MKASEHCWQTGTWSDGCICEICDHRNECSGFTNEEEDE